MIIDLAKIIVAVRKLEEGKLVAFPTETVYGLGGDAENTLAITQIYAVKKRPINHPLIIHIAPGADINFWAIDIPQQAYVLMAKFWPGALTLILKRASRVSSIISGGQDSVGLRCPSHPIAQTLLRLFKGGKGGVVAPSANKFGYISPTTAQHVRDEFSNMSSLNSVDYILDGGQCPIGIESTILDLSRFTTHGAILLRPGQITIDQIASVLGELPQKLHNKLFMSSRTSGMYESHYTPHTPIIQVTIDKLLNVLMYLAKCNFVVTLIQRLAGLPLSDKIVTLPVQAEQYAHNLYATLRSLDQKKADIILVEALPETFEWQGINDRLRRATFSSTKILSSLLIA